MNFTSILLVLLILISVGFLTLLERKILSLSQLRLGPNKVLLWGLAQPFMDGIKLLKKSYYLNVKTQYAMLWICCFLVLLLSMFSWFSIPFKYWSNKSLVFLWVFVLVSLNGYFLLYLGLFSSSNFAHIGSVRSVSQSISLEIMLMMGLMVFFCMMSKMMIYMKNNLNITIMMSVMVYMFFIFILIDTHRAPMDLSEGESELVSGFNVEYSSIFFTLIFLTEYANMLMFITLLLLFFYKVSFMTLQMSIFFLLLTRSCFPRCRYDFLMNYCWIKVFPGFALFCLLALVLKPL